MAKQKISLELDKRSWHPGLLAGQIVIISSVDESGHPNIAPKSWISMAAFSGPIIGFGCNTSHHTCMNIQANEDFVVNIPDDSLTSTIYALPGCARESRVADSGLTLAAATRVAAPIIEDCRAHLECQLECIQRFGEEVFIFGRVLAVSADADLLEGDKAGRYEKLRSLFYLEQGLCGVLDKAIPAASRER